MRHHAVNNARLRLGANENVVLELIATTGDGDGTVVVLCGCERHTHTHATEHGMRMLYTWQVKYCVINYSFACVCVYCARCSSFFFAEWVRCFEWEFDVLKRANEYSNLWKSQAHSCSQGILAEREIYILLYAYSYNIKSVLCAFSLVVSFVVCVCILYILTRHTHTCYIRGTCNSALCISRIVCVRPERWTHATRASSWKPFTRAGCVTSAKYILYTSMHAHTHRHTQCCCARARVST